MEKIEHKELITHVTWKEVSLFHKINLISIAIAGGIGSIFGAITGAILSFNLIYLL